VPGQPITEGPTGAQPPVELPAGRVGRAHGLDGSFYVTRPHPRLLTQGTAVRVGELSTKIVRRAGTDARPIVRVEGVDGREAAEALRGHELSVQSADAPRLDEGEFWAHELEGCAVYAGGRRLGVVKRLIELPSCEALEVEEESTDAGEPLLVPMVKDAVLRVAPRERLIEVDAGFLGLADGTGEQP
jgi:16S rRNA processing protein RimM